MQSELNYSHYKSPIGTLTITTDHQKLLSIQWGRIKPASALPNSKHPLLQKTAKQLDEYFAGKRRNFDLPIQMKGTEFQLKAWRTMQKIPYGRTCSYSEQAKNMGRALAVRAVGTANGQNSFPILIPCHRVIAVDGKMGGYTGGLDKKTFLLAHESNCK